MKTKRSCGKCQYFVKIKNQLVGNSGLCERIDSRVDSDHGHKCKKFKALKFVREKVKKEL